MTSELQTGITYALVAGTLWGISPLLLKRGLKHADVSTATPHRAVRFGGFLAGLAFYSGEIGDTLNEPSTERRDLEKYAFQPRRGVAQSQDLPA